MSCEDLSALVDELDSVTGELQAVEIQIQELLEQQQELLRKKNVLNKRIQKLSEDGDAGTSAENGAEDWNKQGFTLVICPLVSLMEDQLMVLNRLGVSATSLNASSSKEHVKWVHNAMIDKKSPLKLIYVTPEKIAKSKLFMSRLEKAYQAGLLSRIAVDEVHCCSQWGHDFRPDYKSLGILKRQFPNAPLIGLTATATSHVLADAQKILCVQRPLTFTASFNRPNLFYEVRPKPSNTEAFIEDVVKLINGRYKKQSGIVYCFSQKDSEQVTISLQKLGIRAGTYHANMEPRDKTKVHTRWSASEIQVVVATVAFGMGIDKPDVRFVIHHSMSKSMENYYQESGRAGRDDDRADCILYYGFGDIFRISSMVVMENVGQKKLYEMVKYCQDLSRCRRVVIAEHFDEVWDSAQCNQMCDNCCRDKAYDKVDITKYGRHIVKILQQAQELDEKLTPLKLIDAWTGKGAAKLRVPDVPAPKFPRDEIERIIAHLLLQRYIKEDFSFTAYATISYLKKGPKVELLKNEKHSICIQMRKIRNSGAEGVRSPETSSFKASGESPKNLSPAEMKRSVAKGDRKRMNEENSSAAKKSRISLEESIIID
ncbi:ATP-dependent DNA helicase Q1 isoform 2-T2 [Discoglossus pictus]